MLIHSSKKLKQTGFTYIGILVTVVILGIGMGATGKVWRQHVMADKEKHLFFVGDEIARAIESYYNTSPSGAKELPKNFDDLLADKRGLKIKRHLRKLYLDPMTGRADWLLIRKGQYFVGVYSKSKHQPIKKVNFGEKYEEFSSAKTYQDWRFIPQNMRDMVKPVAAKPQIFNPQTGNTVQPSAISGTLSTSGIPANSVPTNMPSMIKPAEPTNSASMLAPAN